MSLKISDNRKVAYIARQNEEASAILASIKDAVSVENVANAPNGALFIVTLAPGVDTVYKTETPSITLAAHIHGDDTDFELTFADRGIPVYMISYLCYSQN